MTNYHALHKMHKMNAQGEDVVISFDMPITYRQEIDGRRWTGFICLTSEKSGGLFWARKRTFGFI